MPSPRPLARTIVLSFCHNLSNVYLRTLFRNIEIQDLAEFSRVFIDGFFRVKRIMEDLNFFGQFGSKIQIYDVYRTNPN